MASEQQTDDFWAMLNVIQRRIDGLQWALYADTVWPARNLSVWYSSIVKASLADSEQALADDAEYPDVLHKQ